ncbi:MAG: YlmC/YmxH family sporulation protein, partial [Clostridia bacterium]|nr:YlmC/YmxH family sporulation protein [Clostridia bacterium]
MNQKQYSFSEMSRKTVINVADGRELGHICDMLFNNCGGVLGFIVPGKKSFFKSITTSDNIFIPWNRIIKIGSDVILTELVGSNARTCEIQDHSQGNQVYTY